MAETRPSPVIFEKYELGRLLGCGAFAKVYHARDLATGHSVAIKIISKNKISGTSLACNIKREISVMRRLNHPRIVKLFEVLATKTKIFFVMEFVKGGELFGKVSRGRFSENLARRIFQQLISAVGYCHSRGVFHRDLKPENLLVDENGDLKVSDFGLSAVADGSVLHTLCGTPAYVAPEILAKNGYDGAKVDVWSAGVVLFVLVSGYLPFNDPNLMAMYKKIYRGEFRFPKWVSPDLKRFLRRLLDTNPDTRITVDEIMGDPWFQKGYKEMKFHQEGGMNMQKEGFGNRPLNAFDIISFSPGLDLSGFFEGSCGWDEERFVSQGSPEEVMGRVLKLCEKCDLKVKWKKEMGLEMEENNGVCVIGVEIFHLVDGLVVVQVGRRGGDAMAFDMEWKMRIKPELVALIDHMDIQEEEQKTQLV